MESDPIDSQAGDIDGAGSLLAGDSINLNLSGDPATGAGGTLVNSGNIAGRNIVSINADNIHNLQGRISANNTQLNAQHDINNLGGQISGNDSLSLNAGHDINIVSTTQDNRNQWGQTPLKNHKSARNQWSLTPLIPLFLIRH